MKIEISDEILKGTIEACQLAFEKKIDGKYLALYTFWLNQQAAGKYRQETIHETQK